MNAAVIDCWRDGPNLVCDLGEIGSLDSQLHLHLYGDANNWRPCIHAPHPAPQLMMFGRDLAMAVTAQRTEWLQRCWPCYAWRTGDLITLAVDHVGEVLGTAGICAGPPGQWTWRLHPMRWSDLPDDPTDHLLLGVWPD
jgi:hypothetical protein